MQLSYNDNSKKNGINKDDNSKSTNTSITKGDVQNKPVARFVSTRDKNKRDLNTSVDNVKLRNTTAKCLKSTPPNRR